MHPFMAERLPSAFATPDFKKLCANCERLLRRKNGPALGVALYRNEALNHHWVFSIFRLIGDITICIVYASTIAQNTSLAL